MLKDDEEVDGSEDGCKRSEGEAEEDKAHEAELVHHQQSDVHLGANPCSRSRPGVQVPQGRHRHVVR